MSTPSDHPVSASAETAAQQGAQGGASRRRLLIIFAILVVLMVWAVATATAVLTAERELEQAREHLRGAERLLHDTELAGARAELAEAVDASGAAADQLTRPYVMPFRVVPWIGPNLEAVTTLAVAARDIGQDAGALLDVADEIVHGEGEQELGEISLDYITVLAPPMRELVTTLQLHTERIERLDPDPLIDRSVRARELFLEVVEPNLAQAATAADLLDVLPAFLGEDEPRTYLVGAGALSELRGSAGLLGSWTLMTADGGRMHFEDFVDIDELPRPNEPVEAPSESFERRYAGFGALRSWRNVNFSPDFEAVAPVIMDLYESGGGGPVDGVIVADTVVFERLAERSGGFDVPGWGRLSASETLRFVGLEAYDAFDSDDERKRVLGAVATSAFAEMFRVLDDDDVPRTIEMLAELAEGGHFLVYSRDEDFRAVARQGGVAGQLPSSRGESAGLFLNNLAENKLDFFAERSIEHTVHLDADGVTRAEVAVRLTNDAPREGHRRGVLGPWVDGLEAGDTRWLATFTCGLDCAIEDAPPLDHVGGVERGRTMHDHLETVRAGEAATFSYATSTPHGWWEEDGLRVVAVEHLVQPTLHGTELRIVVEVPDGSRVVETSAGANVADGEVVWESRTSGRVDLRVVLDEE